LAIPECQNVDDAFIKKLTPIDNKIKWRSKIKSLSFHRCSRITCQCLKDLATIFPCLIKLDLSFCKVIASELCELASFSCRIQSLDISQWPRLDNEAIIVLIQHCPSLTELDLSQQPDITDEAIVMLAKQCRMLTSLELSFCSSLTNITLLTLAEHCPRLVAVGVAADSKFTKAVREQVARKYTIIEKYT
jgi:F-box/leucine-rich repeat protein 2/20